THRSRAEDPAAAPAADVGLPIAVYIDEAKAPVRGDRCPSVRVPKVGREGPERGVLEAFARGDCTADAVDTASTYVGAAVPIDVSAHDGRAILRGRPAERIREVVRDPRARAIERSVVPIARADDAARGSRANVGEAVAIDVA